MLKTQLAFAALLIAPLTVQGALIDLASSGAFAVLAGTTITNTGLTSIWGDIGVSAGTAITGFPPGLLLTGTFHSNDAMAQLAQTDLTNAYNNAIGLPCNTSLTGQDLGGLILLPGVYCFSSSAQLTGILTLDNLADPTGSYVFQIGSTLTTASASSVQYTGANSGNSVFWQIGSSATLGTTTNFSGNILASASITMNTGAVIDCGRALAQTGAVTLDTNTISISACAADPVGVPEPASLALVFTSLAVFAFRRFR